jgi:hypothetical protein
VHPGGGTATGALATLSQRTGPGPGRGGQLSTSDRYRNEAGH